VKHERGLSFGVLCIRRMKMFFMIIESRAASHIVT
jgi:hypothetical protein